MDNRVDLNREFAAFGGLEILDDTEKVAAKPAAGTKPASSAGKYQSGLGDDLLKDLEAVAKKNEQDKKDAKRREQSKKDNKIQMIIIAVSAVILLIVAYFAAFNPGSTQSVADNEVPARVAPVTTPARPTQTASRRSRYNSASDPNRRTAEAARTGRTRGRSTRTQGYERHDSGM